MEKELEDISHKIIQPEIIKEIQPVIISERQKILWKFNIVNILVSVIDYCLEKLSNNNELIKSQTFFLENVKGLLSYLAKGEEAIKISIYVLALKKIFILEESLSMIALNWFILFSI